MCGIAGIFGLEGRVDVNQSIMKDMVQAISHRGPDDEGYYLHPRIHLGHCRLSIIDLEGGAQPLGNEDGSIQVVFNGEIFNHIELRNELLKRGHRFATHSDTEVLVHLYEDHGKNLCRYLNGQFAFAIWDSRDQTLMLARDRIGILPLYYSYVDGNLVFASEIKGLFRYPGIVKEFDPIGLHELYTLWATIPPRTVFCGINELPPATILTASPSGIKNETYWQIRFPDMQSYEPRDRAGLADELRNRLKRSVDLRLRSDVPVGTYLSGGIDSSVITRVARDLVNQDLHSFSIRFTDTAYDEGSMQKIVADTLATRHHNVTITMDDIGLNYERMIYHSEKPVWRSAPVPMMTLSSLVRDRGLKVILTGEGADEILGGYNIFKENAIRRFWARDPQSVLRPVLLSNLYTYINREDRASRFWTRFFAKNLQDTDNPLYSHAIRWDNSSSLPSLYNGDFFRDVDFHGPLERVKETLPDDFMRWHPLCRAQHLEMAIFLPGYLLSSQGERMTMANSVEGRYPFLDHELIEWASTLHPSEKLYGLNEKFILKKTYHDSLPAPVIHRPKQPYRAPSTVPVLLSDPNLADYIQERKIRECGIFDPVSVGRFIKRLGRQSEVSARDDMFLNFILSTMILYNQFIKK